MNDFTTDSRRRFLKFAGALAGAGVLAAALPRRARADDLPHLAETDPTAAALGYKETGASVDAVKYPTHQTAQVCANCRFFLGTDKTPWAGCQLFAGKAVSEKGWCSGYNVKA